MIPVTSQETLAARVATHIPALDGLRGLAVLLVLMHHFGRGGQVDYPRFAGKVFFSIATLGWVGVDLFFVLSGFLITGILVRAKGSDHYFLNFFARRTLRIFPLYYLVLVVCWILLPWACKLPVAQPASQWLLWCYGTGFYLMVSTEWSGAVNPLGLSFAHFWSLAVEEHFYIFWPLLVYFCSRRRLVAACVAILVVAPLLRGWFVGMGFAPDEIPYYMTPCRVDSLAAGGLLAIAVACYSDECRLRQLAYALLGVGGIGIALLYGYTRLDRSHAWVAVVGYSLLAALASGVLLRSILMSEGSLMGRWMCRGLFPFLGKYSYGIYVYHGLLFLILADGPLSTDALHAATGRYFISILIHCFLGVAISVGLAWISWHLYEKHFLKLKRFFAYERIGERS